MGLLVETSVFIAVERKIITADVVAVAEELVVSVLTLGEIMVGALQAPVQRSRDRAMQTCRWIKESYRVLGFGDKEIEKYAEITVALNQSGAQIGAIDRLIAATAMAEGFGVLTMDSEHFGRIKGLRVVAP